MTVYYNEIDPYAAQWLRNLIAAGHLAKGEVDERSITEIQPDDLLGFNQCHFFAGVGVWGHALRQAGWADDRPVWTGSCPCQPFSAAGKQEGFADERHLWPAWFNLIRECRPAIVLGEQVAGALDWLDLVSTDMENAGYAFGAADLCAAGFGGAHIRQRLYFAGVGNSDSTRTQIRIPETLEWKSGDTEVNDDRGDRLFRSGEGRSEFGGLANAERERLERRSGSERGQFNSNRQTDSCRRADKRSRAPMLGRDAADWLYCRDGKWRPVEPSTFPLADAATSRVGRLRAYGNGLDAETATQFVGAVMDCAP